MATSGSWNYSLTAGDIINAAAQELKVLGEGQTLSSADQTILLARLNTLVKQWQGSGDFAPGLKVHTRKTITMFLAKNQSIYTIGPASTDARATTQYGRTTLSAAEAAGQSTISITSNTDTTTYPGTTVTMTASDIVGIELDDGTLQWTTISGTPSTTMDIANTLTSAASSGNYVYWFTSRAQRFPVVEYISLRDENLNDIPLSIFRTVQEYESLADKTGTGDPMCVLVEPLTLNTRITLDTYPQDVTKQLRITALYPAEDYDATTDDIAYPQEWYAPLYMELAKRSIGTFSTPWTQEQEQARKEALSIARNVNPEMSSAFFEVGGL